MPGSPRLKPNSYPVPQPRQAPVSTPKPRKPKRSKIISLLTVLVIGWIVFMIGTPIYAWSQTNAIAVAPAGDRPPEQPGTTILLVGSDARNNLSKAQRKKLGTGSTKGKRTDTMLILYIPPQGKPALVSLPRDSYVPIPGNGKNKLNAAYAFGGAPLLVQSVEQNTGLRIDGYLEIGFLGIYETVEALGGIDVCLKKPIKDRYSRLDLPAGCQTLNGKNALGYVRMRKVDPRGDIGRMERQREMIGKIAKKATRPENLLNPVVYWNLNMAASNNLTKGEDTALSDIASAALSFRKIATGDGYTLVVPIADANARTNAGSSVIWNKKKAAKLFEIIKSGDTTGLREFVKVK
ncbi:MAG: transcriptional regulator [Propionibacterium sp.]|nr:MAG: transcriptional regulator [Propionibacterium sp.]